MAKFVFGSHSKVYLAPVFGKTQYLAQWTGVTRAAALVHDERIGIGNVYHLFRLPEDMEQSLHRILQDAAVTSKVEQLVTNQATALAELRTTTGLTTTESIGPTRIGDIQQLRTFEHWSVTAAHYVRAFEYSIQIYPYFSTPLS